MKGVKSWSKAGEDMEAAYEDVRMLTKRDGVCTGRSRRTLREELELFWRRLSKRNRLCLVAIISATFAVALFLNSLQFGVVSGCHYAQYGWVRTAEHAYGRVDHRRLPKKGGCNNYNTGPNPGFCLCNLTSIAMPSDWGHGPIRCEDACREHRIEGKPLPLCPRETDKGKPCQSHHFENNPRLSELYSAFMKARGKSANFRVKLPGKRKHNEDFVWEGKSLSNEEVKTVISKIQNFRREEPSFPSALFRGRGIAIVGGNGRYQTPFWVAVHAIRRTGSKLPIEIWFPEKEVPNCHRIRELAKLDVTVRSFGELTGPAKQGWGILSKKMKLHSFMYKIFALVFSSFQETLLLDSDIVAIQNPDDLFEEPLYEQYGSLFWKDFWNSSTAPDCQRILGKETLLDFSHESGQIVMDKSRNWEALMLALYMNSHPDFFYPLSVNYMGIGDKEIIPMAILALDKEYGIVEDGPDHVGMLTYLRAGVIGNTMMQHKPNGEPMFMHANIGKMSKHVPASRDMYVKRWQASLIHGTSVAEVVNKYAGTDLEMWVYDLLVSNHCLFDAGPSKKWHEKIGVGPFIDGMTITDHANLNINLKAVKVLEEKGYNIHNVMIQS